MKYCCNALQALLRIMRGFINKPFVISRKNFLFANTPSGARSSAVLFSLIETAKENGLDPYLYLVWLLKEAPARFATDRDWAESLLPQYAPNFCRT